MLSAHSHVKALLEGVTGTLSGKVTGFVFGRLKIGSWQTRMFRRPDPILCTGPGKRKWWRLRDWPQRWVSRDSGLGIATPWLVLLPGAHMSSSQELCF